MNWPKILAILKNKSLVSHYQSCPVIQNNNMIYKRLNKNVDIKIIIKKLKYFLVNSKNYIIFVTEICTSILPCVAGITEE